jgi:hypothetical protein
VLEAPVIVEQLAQIRESNSGDLEQRPIGSDLSTL